MSCLDLTDIQGNILHGYRMSNVRHFGLTFGTTKGAQTLLGLMVGGNAEEAPQITNASIWSEPPKYCLNAGLTADGLRVLGLSKALMELFPAAFLRGPTHDAVALGDDGPGAPDKWVLGGVDGPAVHAMISLYTDGKNEDQLSAWLHSIFVRHDAHVIFERGGIAMPDDNVHFNLRDSISQPRIKGSPVTDHPDMQPMSEPGEFLLGKDYTNQFGGNFADDLPRELVDNGTYGAFRILKQEVFKFEDFIRTAGQKYNMDPELIAAKMVGRWRDGTPLVLAPEENKPMPVSELNNFDYAPSEGHPDYYDDSEGFRCPASSHIRRMNPRGALVMGKPHTRRIIRRNYPYGPAIQTGDAADDIERGLIGFFICGDLEMQFEFLQKVWANTDIATTGLRGTRDPITGAQPEFGGQYVIRTQNRSDPVIFDDLPRLVITRGSAYCFIPSIGGLRFLAGA